MAQIKQVDIKDLLKDFSKYGPQLVTFKPHDFVVINEDIFQYLEANTFSDSDSKTIAKNIIDYIDFLEVQKKRETFASFANMFIQDIYKNGQKFIFQYCPSIAQKLFMYTSQIK
jgi:hypothetical protein